MNNKTLILLAAASFSISLMAQEQVPPRRVPAAPYPIEVKQPDGSTFQMLLRGDERSHYSMTMDGWQIIQNDKEWYCYAVAAKDGTIVAGKRVVRAEAQRSRADQRWLKKHGINKINNQ